MSLVHSRQRSKGSPNFLKNEVKEEVLNEIKFLWSASQKHGAECPESRFILLMFHGIHPVEDSKADKLLHSKYVGVKEQKSLTVDRAFRVANSIASLRTLGRVAPCR